VYRWSHRSHSAVLSCCGNVVWLMTSFTIALRLCSRVRCDDVLINHVPSSSPSPRKWASPLNLIHNNYLIRTDFCTRLTSHINRGAYKWNSCLLGWWSGVVVSALASINEVNQRPARLVLRWVTVSGFSFQWGTFISVCDQPPRSTQPGHPFVGRRNEYQKNGDDALRLGSKGRYGSCVGGR